MDDRPENFFARLRRSGRRSRRSVPDYVAPRAVAGVQPQPHRLRRSAADRRQARFKIGDRIHVKGDIYPVNRSLTVQMIFDHPKNTEC
jgi:hypothetical protein